jgi:16S rRNA (cytosine1402-N4)-methyltransferase
MAGPRKRSRSDRSADAGPDDARPRAPHTPVLLAEVLAALRPSDGERHIDGTFGAGGYSTAILDAADCEVMAFDRDATAVRAADAVTARYPGRLRVLNAPFGRMDEFTRLELTPDGQPLIPGPLVDGIVLDIGVSSMQLDRPERGFSFNVDGPLDMRMSQPVDGDDGPAGPSAADFLNTADEATIADVLYQYGDEKRSRTIARAIVTDRDKAPFTTTLQLAGLVGRILGRRHDDAHNPATRTFQALRIHVNDELGELAAALAAAERLLKSGGRLVVVTFHSLEDRLVKRFMADAANRIAAGSRHAPPLAAPPPPSFQLVNPKPVLPSPHEIAANPRARSAKLRSAVRTDAPALSRDMRAFGLPPIVRLDRNR